MTYKFLLSPLPPPLAPPPSPPVGFELVNFSMTTFIFLGQKFRISYIFWTISCTVEVENISVNNSPFQII